MALKKTVTAPYKRSNAYREMKCGCIVALVGGVPTTYIKKCQQHRTMNSCAGKPLRGERD